MRVLVLVALAGCDLVFELPSPTGQDSIELVQVNSTVGINPVSSRIEVTYNSSQTEGALNVVVVAWNNSANAVGNLSDTSGNDYRVAIGPMQVDALLQQIFYAPAIAAAGSGANTVEVDFISNSLGYDIRILEYTGFGADPFDVASGRTGLGTMLDSGSANVRFAGELLIAAAASCGLAEVETPPGFTERVASAPGSFVADTTTDEIGPVAATASRLGASSVDCWIMQLATFKAN